MFIALLGLPGAGKSTMARALGDLFGGVSLLEPEEDSWPSFVRRPHFNGDFTMLTWFRTQRVPLYYEAASLRSSGKVAILDSYYDKWCSGWLDKPGFEWLIAPDDPYLPVAMAMARADALILPAADVVVVLEIEEGMWRRQLGERGRNRDSENSFLNSHHGQHQIVEAALRQGRKDRTLVLRHQRKMVSPQQEAVEVGELLRDAGIATPSW